jgi:hypothetical protein
MNLKGAVFAPFFFELFLVTFLSSQKVTKPACLA